MAMIPFLCRRKSLTIILFALVLLVVTAFSSLPRFMKMPARSAYSSSVLRFKPRLTEVLAASTVSKESISSSPLTTTTTATTTSKPTTTTTSTPTTTTATTSKPTTTTTTATTATTSKPTTVSRQERMKRTYSKMRERGMSSADKILTLDLLRKIVSVADDLGLVYFMHGGTMIGSWRHHGIIPWDDDIDLAFNITDKEKLRAGILALGAPYKCNQGSVRIKMWSEHSTIQTPYAWKWPYIDVIFTENNATHLWEKAGEFRKQKYKMTDIFPLHKRPFENMWLNAPHNSVALYLLYYGKPEWCTTWYYAHKTEKATGVSGFNCSELAPYCPFVHQDIVNGTVRETLKLENVVVHSLLVPGESVHHITAPYGFRLLN